MEAPEAGTSQMTQSQSISINTNIARSINSRPAQLQRNGHKRQQSSLSSFHTPPPSASSTLFFFSSPQTPSKQIIRTSSSSVTTPASIHSQSTFYDKQGKYQGPVAVHAGSFPSLQKHFTRDCVSGVGSPSRYTYDSQNEEEGMDTKLVYSEGDTDDDSDDNFEYPPSTPLRLQKTLLNKQNDYTSTLPVNDSVTRSSKNRRSVLVNTSKYRYPEVLKIERPLTRYSVYLTNDDFEDLSNPELAITAIGTMDTKNQQDQYENDDGRVKAGQSFDYESFSRSSAFLDIVRENDEITLKNTKKKNPISNMWRRVTNGLSNTSMNNHGQHMEARTGNSMDVQSRSKLFHKRNKSSAI